MKGFIKVAEAIIASMILFLSLLYTSYTPETGSWSTVIVKTNAEDAIISLEKNGSIERFLNGSLTRNNFLGITDALISENIEYQLDFRRIPKFNSISSTDNSPIDIYCICNDSKWNEIDTLLGSQLSFADRNIQISKDHGDTYADNLRFRSELDVFIITEDINFNFVKAFLENGQSILFLKNLSESDVSNLENLFGISWNNELSDNNNFEFVNNTHGKTVERYYDNMTNSGTLTFSASSNNKIEPSTGFSIVGDGKSMLVGNIPTEDRGRTLWMPDYSGSNFNSLLKSGVLWLSTSRFVLNKRDIPNEIPSTIHTIIGVFNGYPYEMRITVWRSFY